MVHQHFMLVPVMTVTENIVLGEEPTRGVLLDVREGARRVKELSDRYGLAVDPDGRDRSRCRWECSSASRS
jgi:simple sugar transport system ATP-binding protein